MTEPWKAALISLSRSSIDKVQALVFILLILCVKIVASNLGGRDQLGKIRMSCHVTIFVGWAKCRTVDHDTLLASLCISGRGTFNQTIPSPFTRGFRVSSSLNAALQSLDMFSNVRASLFDYHSSLEATSLFANHSYDLFKVLACLVSTSWL